MSLTPKQRAAQTKEFDREFVADTFGPTPRKDKLRIEKILKRARRK